MRRVVAVGPRRFQVPFDLLKRPNIEGLVLEEAAERALVVNMTGGHLQQTTSVHGLSSDDDRPTISDADCP